MRFLKNLWCGCCQPRRVYFYLLLAILVPNVALCFTENYSVGASLCNILLPLSIYGYLFTLRRSPGLMAWILFPFIFLAAFQLVLLYLFGNSIIAVDMFLNLVTTNASEAMELLDNLVPAVLFVFLLYVPALVFATVLLKRKEKLPEKFVRNCRRLSLGGCLLGLLLMGGTYLVDEDYEAKVDLFPLNVCYNCYLAVERTEDVARYAETSRDFSFEARATHDPTQPEVYILVIGETGRACNWGLYGYERNTTPRLQQEKGLVCFKDVLTQSNTTHKSVPMLMSRASAENYDRIYHEKSVITAFKEAGFHTAFYSNQKYNHAFIDIFGKEADEVVFLKEEGKWGKNPSDMQLLSLVDALLKKGHRKLFIVLHTYGSHFNYRERYAQEMAVFQPEKIMDAHPKYREMLVNAYDNSIVQTDTLLAELIAFLKQQNALASLIYTSDHGEDIFDDERNHFLHSSPVPTYYQLHVPFIIWTSAAYAQCFPQVVNHLYGNSEKAVSSNVAVVPTLLQLAGLDSPCREDSLSVADADFRVRQRHYINDHNLPKTYDDVGMDEEDERLFHLHHLVFP